MAKKVKFILSADIVADATEGLLLGEFNNWDIDNGFTMKKAKDGSLMATVSLEEGRAYQYRYLLNDGRWVNDQSAQYIHDERFHVANCVIEVPAGEESAVAVSAVKAKAAKAKAAKAKAAPAVKEAKTAPAVKEVKAAKKTIKEVTDDLTKIEGVGKKIAEILSAEQIVSFQDLAKSTPKKIRTILDAAGSKFQMHDPATWPKQAKLAAAGKWDELKKLQSELKGGK
jgi:predicted flap endonuclease-1-like 5' DNA nuclease